jgi:subtilisin family serine protease
MAKRKGSGEKKPVPVLVEMRVQTGTPGAFALEMAASMDVPAFQLDPDFEAVPMSPSPDQVASLAAAGEEVVIVRGMVEEDKIQELEEQPNVLKVWRDTPIAPFAAHQAEEEEPVHLMPTAPMGPCPIPTCDCNPGTAKGTIADVAQYLGVDHIWARGHRGQGIVIGIVDGGITAAGRVPGGTIPRVIDGWRSDWGKKADWGGHGNMTATDALGMAPQAQIYDIRISGADFISNALAGFQWAINRHRANGTPHILSNSWGIFQESWDQDYARNPNHPFTRKAVEALNEGILVLFAAGNCGGTCPDGRCDSDSGPGKSIWGANGHPRVMTVGAVNKNEQFIGYSSQGPAALDPHKPDFCSVSHFKGYFASDSGTSAACPVAAGVVALLKQAQPSLTQDQAKQTLMDKAKDIGPSGWDQHSGAGIIQAKAAHDAVIPVTTVRFQVDTYEMKVARELNASGQGMSIKFPAYIRCEGEEYHVVIYVLDDTSPVPENTFLPQYKRGTIFVPRWQYEWYVDLLRNEKPVYCYLNSETPKWNSLYTGSEPVGEQEV